MTVSILPVPVADGVHAIRLDLAIEDFAICASCAAVVFVRMIELHRRQCEPRSYDLEPLTPGEIGL